MKVAIDAMGGDTAPGPIIEAIDIALSEQPEFVFLLTGPEECLKSEIGAERLERFGNKVVIVDAPEVIGMNEHPMEALRQKRNNSISMMVGLTKQGKADIMLSAGNTGAVVGASTVGLGLRPGVQRAGIAIPIPTPNGLVLLLDVGANVNARPSHLLQYGVLGAGEYRSLTDNDCPRVALLSVGAETSKGNNLVKDTNALFRRVDIEGLGFEFIGNVEGHDMLQKAAEVVVCDGFVGNVALKIMEAMGQHVGALLTAEVEDAPEAIREHIGGHVARYRKQWDWAGTGGAILLGVQGTAVIAHGRSDARALLAALRLTTHSASRWDDQVQRGLESVNKLLKTITEHGKLPVIDA